MVIDIDNIIKVWSDVSKIQQQRRDNLFSANKRGQMLRQYGYSEAQTITVGDLC